MSKFLPAKESCAVLSSIVKLQALDHVVQCLGILESVAGGREQSEQPQRESGFHQVRFVAAVDLLHVI